MELVRELSEVMELATRWRVPPTAIRYTAEAWHAVLASLAPPHNEHARSVTLSPQPGAAATDPAALAHLLPALPGSSTADTAATRLAGLAG
jgi:hypothetical protein